MDLVVKEMCLFCGEHPPLETRTQASDSGPMSPVVFIHAQIYVSKYVLFIVFC